MTNKMTNEDFVAKAIEIHGNKDDYSLVDMSKVHNTQKDKVCIVCHIHGPYWKTPYHHLQRKQGCPYCKNPRHGMNTESFIVEANKVHNNRYTYPNTVYKTSNTKVKIVCPIHGEFEQQAHVHLEGHGCPKCATQIIASKRRTSKIKFVDRANATHNFKYDYDKVEYVNSTTKVTIICPIHGEFEQAPAAHLSGCGCPSCGVKNRGIVKKTKRLSYEEAKKIVRTMCLKNSGEYKKVFEKMLKLKRLPKCPQEVYKNEGWVSWPVFLGNEQKSTKYISYNEAKKYVNSLGLTSVGEWKQLCKQKKIPFNIPYNPMSTYKGKGWCGMGEWLGKTYKSRIRKFYSYEEAKTIIQRFNLKSVDEFYELIKRGELPYKFPKNPQHKYEGKWECWPTFLGYENGIRKNYKFKLINEFADEFKFRTFLANNDVNILLLILGSLCELEPKYAPLERDIERALANASVTDPIEALEQKYSTESESEPAEIQSNTTETETVTTQPTATIDLDNDEEVYAALATATDEPTEGQNEPSIEDVIRNDEQELQVINRIEHMLTPEIRSKIMNKYLNDRRRAWMASRETNK